MSQILQRLRYPSIPRTFSTFPSRRRPFGGGPSPPRLPKEDQETFERLQQQSTGAFSTPRRLESAQAEAESEGAPSRALINQSPEHAASEVNATVQADGEGEELHPDVRRGAQPEFEGEVNPKTGEVGGPKNEPLRWGPEGDYSFNGRVTDF